MSRVRTRCVRFVAVLVGVQLAAGALSQETTTYSYDALGRMINAVISGGPNSG
jgi:YD repeat-containing protein